MIKLSNLGLAAVLALGAGPALAQDVEPEDPGMFMQEVPTPPTMAAELFGPGTDVKVEFGAAKFEPMFILTYQRAKGHVDDDSDVATPSNDDSSDNDQTPGDGILDMKADDEANSVEAGDEGMLTFHLEGAVFAERVSPNDFSTTADGTEATTDDDALEITAGGAKGDASVTLKVTAGAAWANGYEIMFDVADLTASGRHEFAPVRMMATSSKTKKNNYPEGNAMPANCDPNFFAAFGVRDTDATVRGCRLVEADSYIARFDLKGGSTSRVDLADRTKLIGGDGKHLADVAIGTVSVMAESGDGIKGQDGDAASFSGDLAGDAVITVHSKHFREGDVVYIDDDGNKKPDDPREVFDMADGMATADRALTSPANWTVRYMPNGKDELMHDMAFTVTAMTNFTDRDNKNATATEKTDAGMDFRPARPAIGSILKLNGIEGAPAKAYALAPIGAGDIANVRITCESGSDCHAFLSCYDPDGMGYFGDAGIMIPSNGTKRLDQEMVAMELGMMMGDESWTGRLSCDVLSTEPVSVQVLTRAAGVLVNNTYVAPGG